MGLIVSVRATHESVQRQCRSPEHPHAVALHAACSGAEVFHKAGEGAALEGQRIDGDGVSPGRGLGWEWWYPIEMRAGRRTVIPLCALMGMGSPQEVGSAGSGGTLQVWVEQLRHGLIQQK